MSKAPWLPFDTSRCEGGSDKLCDTCLRWLAPGNPHGQWYIAPPASIKRGECVNHIPHTQPPAEAVTGKT